MSVTVSISAPGDIPTLKALWKQAFGDEDVWIDLFFDEAYVPAGLFVLREEEKIAAMAAWFPGTLCDRGRGWPTAYLYAVATEKSCRGKGHCRRLLDFMAGALAGVGIDCLCLKPGAADLFDFYKRLGFETFFACEALTFEGLAPVCGAVEAVDAPVYLQAREAALQDRTYVSSPVPVLSYQKKAARQGGGDLFVLTAGDQTGCAVAVRDGDCARLQELLWPGDPAQAAALVCAHMAVTRAVARTPGASVPSGMLRWLRTKPELEKGYLGIALD